MTSMLGILVLVGSSSDMFLTVVLAWPSLVRTFSKADAKSEVLGER
jgi:hypothetical protein